jgi:predicted DNA-binding transcriptional regulator AlpA
VPIHERLTWGLDDLSALTGLSRRTLERERSAGRLPKPDLRVGKRVLWKPETIREWVEGGGR